MKPDRHCRSACCGAAHMVAGEDNDQFNAAVEAFLKRRVQV